MESKLLFSFSLVEGFMKLAKGANAELVLGVLISFSKNARAFPNNSNLLTIRTTD